MTTTVTLNPDRTFTISAPAGHVQYVATFPIERFDSWLAFYRRMEKKRPKFYAADVAALKAIEPEVRKLLAEVAA
jgi:hypothetical protein